MLEAYDKAKCGSNVSSGETEQLKRIQAEWYKLYDRTIRDRNEKVIEYLKWTYDDVVENPGPFLDAIKDIKIIPSYQYVINYLLWKLDLGVGKDNQREFLEFIGKGRFKEISKKEQGAEEVRICLLSHESGQGQRKFSEEDYQDLWQILIVRLGERFEENGYKPIGWEKWIDFFSGMLESFSYASLKRLALGIHMPLADFQVFLTKVLKRSYINFYDRDEVFVYLALKYADECGCGTYEAYNKIRKLYPLRKDADIDEKPEWETKKDSVSTVALKKELDKRLKGSSSLLKTADKKIQDYLDYITWQNMRLKDKNEESVLRTAKKRFQQLWEELKYKWVNSEEAIEDDIFVREKQKKKIGQEEEGVYKELTVIYNPEVGGKISAGMRFEAKTLSESINGGRTAEFCLLQEQMLPQGKMEYAEVKVKALMSETEYEKWKESVPALKELDLGQFVRNEPLEKRTVEMKVDSADLKNNIGNIRINRKVRYFMSDDKLNEGTLLVECKPGTFIPKGSRFSFELEGVIFCYESLEDANTCEFKLVVRPQEEWNEKWEGIGLNKRSKLEKGAQFRVCLPEETGELQGIRKAFVGKAKDVANFKEGQEKNYITVVCKKNCCIPKGTIFEYQRDGKCFQFESVETIEKKPLVEIKVKVKWENIEEFQRSASDKLCSFFQENAQVLPKKGKLENVYGIYIGNENNEDVVTDSCFLRKIYGISEKENADKNGYYKGFKQYGKDYFLNSELFKDTRIVRNNLMELPANEERLRNLILTLKFLEYVEVSGGEPDQEGYGVGDVTEEDIRRIKDLCKNYKMDSKQMDEFLNRNELAELDEKLAGDFLKGDNGVDAELMRCGFHTFSTTFPYDAFLMMLLYSYEPLELFQAIWSDRQLLRQEEEDK